MHHEGYARESKGASQGACAREGRAGERTGTAGARVVMSVLNGAPSMLNLPTQLPKMQVVSGATPARCLPCVQVDHDARGFSRFPWLRFLERVS